MHEAGIAQNILDIVIETAMSNNANIVKKVFVKIGKLQAVEMNSLMFAFDALKEGTIANSAELIVEEVDIKGRCLKCGKVADYDDFYFSCKFCGSYDVELISGEE